MQVGFARDQKQITVGGAISAVQPLQIGPSGRQKQSADLSSDVHRQIGGARQA